LRLRPTGKPLLIVVTVTKSPGFHFCCMTRRRRGLVPALAWIRQRENDA
jgi:hypothetical protein